MKTIIPEVLIAFSIITFIFSLFYKPSHLNNHTHSEITQSSNDSIRTEIRRYKLDSLRLELAIIEADMRNDSIRNDIRKKLQQSKP